MAENPKTDPKAYNIAADYIIEQALEAHGIEIEGPLMTPEEYQAWLSRDTQHALDTHVAHRCALIDHEPEEACEDLEKCGADGRAALEKYFPVEDA